MAAERASGVGSGSARRRKKRQLRSWWRHEQWSIATAQTSATLPSAQGGERLVSHNAPRGLTNTGAGGRRPGVLKEHEPRVGTVRAASVRTAVPSLATPSLADATADVVDASAVQ